MGLCALQTQIAWVDGICASTKREDRELCARVALRVRTGHEPTQEDVDKFLGASEAYPEGTPWQVAEAYLEGTEVSISFPLVRE